MDSIILFLALALLCFPVGSLLSLIIPPSLEASKEERNHFKLNKPNEIVNIVISSLTILYTLYLFFIIDITSIESIESFDLLVVYLIDSVSLLVLITLIPIFLLINQKFGRIASYSIFFIAAAIPTIIYFNQIISLISGIISVSFGLVFVLLYSIYIFIYNIYLSCNGEEILATLNRLTYSIYLIGAFVAFMSVFLIGAMVNFDDRVIGISLSIWFLVKIILSIANLRRGRNIFEENVVKF